MLKALELHGFKSFADKTRFEFPPGITVVVGPNGSGKSNIVDAIKWVLGEQSAKSLRGKDMADVIFKGSGQSGRKPMNTAEATLVFDNADRRLPIDAPEVHVTRRVYRSGEGEYLINRQPARLKDIRDMFRGTGVGGDAYSLIEQGKVDRMLQASAKDRRAIFEEAAGISRFKAKKIETQRRLERVEQNLLRLSDIVEEVESRLKAVRAQAGKARRYREYSERLQQLRTQIALVDWRRLSERLNAALADQAAVAEQLAAAEQQDQQVQARQAELESAAAALAAEARACEAEIAAWQQRLAQEQAASSHEKLRAAELSEEGAKHRHNLFAMSERAGDLRQRLEKAQDESRAAEASHQAALDELASRQGELDALLQEHQAIRQQVEASRQRFVEQLRLTGGLARQVEASETNLHVQRRAAHQTQAQLQELAATQVTLSEELTEARAALQTLAEEVAANQSRIEAVTDELAENRNLHAARADDLAQLGSRRHGILERTAVLEEFERTLEGYGAGVKELLAGGSAHRAERRTRGVVADFVLAKLEHASAIDTALGEAAQAIVVEGGLAAAEKFVRESGELPSRVMAVGLSAAEAAEPLELTSDMVAGISVIARADKLVEAPDQYLPLVRRLLGRTFVVRTLADAVKLRATGPREARIVSLAGELVDEQGAITFGPRNSATGLVSRRSQLRAAKIDLAVVDQQMADAQRETAHLRAEVERHEQALRQLGEVAAALAQQASAKQLHAHRAAERLQSLADQKAAAESSLATALAGIQSSEQSLATARRELAEAEANTTVHQASVAAGEVELGRLETLRQQALDRVTAAKIEVARCRERVESLALRVAQFERDAHERERALAQVRTQIIETQVRRDLALAAVLQASDAIAHAALALQALVATRQGLAARQQQLAAERAELTSRSAAARKLMGKLRDQQHQLELAAEQVRHERKSLADRLREDYGIELAAVTDEPTPEAAAERAAAEDEIESLRRKINQIGAVNLDALEELDELEARFATLSGQHQDLTEAKQSLERIIHKINGDSRRLFLDTLEAIRVNFQALYRKAFGGGKADILLEEGLDVLECGIEIIATPPGKPSFNNSLLSGGEKALTAVALLLAIFQFRPSPFCVLDEVDAPFDEANIGRFVDVLGGFLQWTRFVIVTHSKKTMTSATTLYGITMQESGVSKRVSVRFEDVTDDGHIRKEALDRSLDSARTENAA